MMKINYINVCVDLLEENHKNEEELKRKSSLIMNENGRDRDLEEQLKKLAKENIGNKLLIQEVLQSRKIK